VIALVLNGESVELDEGATAADAVAASGAPEPFRGVAVAVDGEVVPRGSWDATDLHAGQRVEVLQAVQGG
jgi:sulfur carrier protein